MLARFIHDGKSIDFVPDTNIPAGSVIVQGSLVGVTNDPLYVPEHLQQKRTFTSILNVRYILFD